MDDLGLESLRVALQLERHEAILADEREGAKDDIQDELPR